MIRLDPGTIFARDYRVIAPIASGGMGAVYRVEQLSTLKHRALKVLHTRVVGDERARSRFVREATVGARIESAHVVEVIGAGIDDATNLPWLAMELLDGFDLGAVVGYHGGLGPHELLAVCGQLCHGLSAAHAARIVHRDLKPENVFVARSHRAGSDFTVKILDFGIAKVVRESPVATDTGAVGSPLWMAPEQINAGDLSARTDVWALGLLAFWALTGRLYWKAAHGPRVTVQALFVEQLFSPLAEASVRAAEYGREAAIPEGFDAWFSSCLQREPEHRFADASAAFNALSTVLSEAPAGPGRSILPPADYEPNAASTRNDGVPRRHALGETTLDGTTGDLAGLGVPTLVGTHASGAVAIAADAARQQSEPAVPVVTAEMQPIASSTLVAPVPARALRNGKLITTVGLAAALGGAVLTVAVMTGRDAKRADMQSETLVVPESPQPDETVASSDEDATLSSTEEADGLDVLPLQPKPSTVAEPSSSSSAVANRKATQPSFAPAELELVGWARDGTVFVLHAAHGSETAADGKPANFVELIQVHDALTGSMVESYLRKRVADPEVPKTDRLAKLAAEAEPLREWQDRMADLQLLAPDPRRERVKKTGEIRVTQTEVPLHSKVRMIPRVAGVDFVWFGVDAEGSGRDRSPLGPRLRFELVDADARHELLDIRIPFSYDDVARLATDTGESVSVGGQLRFHWSPVEDRVVIEVHGDSSEPGLHDRRWFVRAAGPQIRLIDGGAGQRAARQAAEDLAASGFPIAVLDLDYSPVERSEIYHRTRDAAAPELSSQLAAALGRDLPTKPLESGGWTTAVIVLGQDWAETQPAIEPRKRIR
mgnify:CR=1 FL=1